MDYDKNTIEIYSLSADVLQTLEDRPLLPIMLMRGLPCPFLRRYRPMELSDYNDEEENTNNKDTTEELE